MHGERDLLAEASAPSLPSRETCIGVSLRRALQAEERSCGRDLQFMLERLCDTEDLMLHRIRHVIHTTYP
jgi:hypothetical protein